MTNFEIVDLLPSRPPMNSATAYLDSFNYTGIRSRLASLLSLHGLVEIAKLPP